MVYANWQRNVGRSSVLIGLLALTSGIAAAQQVSPGSIRSLPGATQPRFNEWELRAQQDDELYIPPTMDRPLGEDAGPRIRISKIDLDIDRTLSSRMDAEVAESIRLMLSGRVAESQAEGFTIGRLENVAAEVTDTLRSAGFILAWAYLPEQSIQDQTVTITVLPGTLESINVDGNDDYSVSRLLDPFGDLLGAPVERDRIEESILYLRNYPGLSTSAVFGPGQVTGTSSLTLRVSEDPLDFALVMDNHGTESTGKNRVRADVFWYNVLGRADLLTLNVLQTFDPAENTYGSVAYLTPMFRHDLLLGLTLSNNAFEVAQGEAAGSAVGGGNLAGDTTIGALSLTKNLRMARRSKIDLTGDIAVKNAQIEGLGRETEDNLTVASIDLAMEAVDGFGAGGVNQLQIRYSKGIPDFLGSMDENGDGGQSTRTGGSGEDAGGDFDKWVLRYQRLQRVSARNSLLFRAEGQMSGDLLTSIEQFVLGGPNNVRAYPIAEYIMDEGYFGSLEWIVDLSSGGDTSFSLSAFADYAWGQLNDPLTNEVPDADLSGWGVGISMGHTSDSGNQFALRLDVATPISDVEPSNGDDPQIYGQLSYTFR